MSFLTYKDTRPWARAMKTAVDRPPDAAVVRQRGRRPLCQRQAPQRTPRSPRLSAWADGGAVEGDEKDRPSAVSFVDGWSITPEMIIEMPQDVPVPATGTINYKNILVKVNFPEDRWVVAADLRPGNARVVHHMRAIVRPPGSDFMRDAVPGVAYENGDAMVGRQNGGTDLLGKFNPGLGGQDFSLFESAKFVPKGSDIVFSMHYTATGTATTDRSRLALVFAKTAAEEALLRQRRPDRVQPGDSGRRRQCRNRLGDDGAPPTRSWSTCSRTCTCAARTTKSG